MNLSSAFAAIAHKELVTVDLPDRGSNQHEINGVRALRDLFQGSKYHGPVTWSYFKDGDDPISEEGSLTFYDARENDPQRTEWRLYYTGQFLYRADPGDVLILARTETGSLYALVFEANSGWLRSASRLFGIEDSHANLELVSEGVLEQTSLELFGQLILEELGISIPLPPEADDESLILERFEGSFPTTREMSDYARSLVDSEYMDVDNTLIAWLSREEDLFRALEKVIVQERLDRGFEGVDDFVSYSLSIQNRRKSRMGHALQNHLAALFDEHRLDFDSQARTEGKKKPDFLFPGKEEYHDPAFDANLLVMLGAKSSCKERWRQILSEADRIDVKHLCTLESGISIDQTNEMRESNVCLVIPSVLHSTFDNEQLHAILSVEEFIDKMIAMQTIEY